MTAATKVLVIGGYGVFSGRLIQLLEDEPRLNLLVAGRSKDHASAFVRSRGSTPAQLTPVAFDRNGDIASDLAAIRPDILVDASGPFQAYGADRYRVVQACLTQRVNYLDLADGSDFVACIDAFDSQAKAAGIYVLSGVSSFPVLTAAAVRRLSAGMTAVKAIRGGIAPSPYAGVGENVIRAIAGYAGKPIRRKRTGAFGTGYPWTEHLRYTVAVPGLVPLGDRLFSLVDVPDLQALATLCPEVDEIWMGAAPVPEMLHRVLAALAWLARLHLLPTLAPLARLMHAATNRIRWGEHRGGMFVEVEGVDASQAPLKRSWHLLAEGDDGPLIPSMAIEAIIRNALRGRVPQQERAPRSAHWSSRITNSRSTGERYSPAFVTSTTTQTTTRRFMRASSVVHGNPFPLRYATSTGCARRTQRRVARKWSADAGCWRDWPPQSSAFRQRVPMCRSSLSLTPQRVKKPGGARSASAAFLAANLADEAGRSICCASILARCDLTSRWWQAASVCRWCCGAGASSACRCRWRFVRIRSLTKASKTTDSISTSGSVIR
jgi:hypothetical protein